MMGQTETVLLLIFVIYATVPDFSNAKPHGLFNVPTAWAWHEESVLLVIVHTDTVLFPALVMYATVSSALSVMVVGVEKVEPGLTSVHESIGPALCSGQTLTVFDCVFAI